MNRTLFSRVPWLVLAALALTAGRAGAATYVVDVGGAMDEAFVRDGWYGPEGPYPQFGPIWRSTCRWARQGAVIRLPVFPGVVNTLVMRAEVRGGADQRLRVFVNGVKVAEVPPSPDLGYSFRVEPSVLGDKPWAEVRLETLHAAPVAGDSRDLRVAVDWFEVSADAPARNYLREALEESGIGLHGAVYDAPPRRWRFLYDPNNAGDTHAPQRFHRATYDDSAFEGVPTGFVPPLRRGEAAWYRAWVVITGDPEDVRSRLRLPGEGFERDGERAVWINGARVPEGPEPLAGRVGKALTIGPNLIAVKLLKGPLPRPSGDSILLPPRFSGRWSPERVLFSPGVLALDPKGQGSRRLRVRLVDPEGATVGATEGEVTDLGDGRRGLEPKVEWPLTRYGEHTLWVEDDAGRRQRFPVHFLGVHLFHWGWYSAGGGTQWRGFKPCSNDYLDQLLGRLGDWGRPHHSICWGGAILAPGTGFHRTQKVNYIARQREEIAAGRLEFVGMPFAPRNICTDFGESLLRGMRRSRALYESQLGARPTRFYSHDATMTPLLPQIMRLCGYDTYCIAENWWGQGRSIPNSRDGYFRNPEGSEVRILDSWYHGVPVAAAAHRAVQQGKPAVLCNEEFACLDRTVFVEEKEVEALAAEGIFLQPITLDEYQQVTEAFARELRTEGDEALCYKGWTGGGEGEVEAEKANRLLETRLVALENLVAFARWLKIEVDQEPIDAQWDLSLRAHECHSHWGNGWPGTTEALRKGIAFADAEMARVAGLITARARANADGVALFNPLGFRRGGVVRLQAPAGTRSLVPVEGRPLPLQPDPDDPERFLAAAADLPSCGFRHYRFSPESAAGGPGASAAVEGDRAILGNGLVRVRVAADGEVVSLSDGRTGRTLVAGANRLYLARAEGKAPRGRVSTEDRPLDLEHYLRAVAAGAPRVVAGGPVMAIVECGLRFPDYPSVRGTMRVALAAGERQARVRLSLDFPEPTVVAPAGGPAPHEGVYVPGIFVAQPMPSGAKPRVDMAYCTTDGVLTSTNHETFLPLPFRNGTFNALSLAGPSSGEYALLTRGLPDFFVLRRPEGLLGLSLGTGAKGCPYRGSYVHEYALFAPEASRRRGSGPLAYRAARSFLVEPLAVPREAGEGTLPPEASFASAEGESVVLPGMEMTGDCLALRVLNLSEKRVKARIRCLAPLAGTSVLPAGQLEGQSLTLGPKAIREVQVNAAKQGS